MKKIFPFCLLMVFMFCGTAQALSWAYPFVVWDGTLYEVKEEERLSENEIAEAIGRVATLADDMSGNYYGNASNFYPVGTVYYAIKDTGTSEAIAVNVEGEYLKAVYSQKAKFHFMNLLLDGRILMIVVLIIMAVIIYVARSKARRN
ncbi:hypothetical protein [Planococcus halotolerans]|uniref:hypothetical protein n=1 Tax=Planococcus halotolerans TaxID=2233542 RepID=UPI001091F8AA|nr:hypothetical protein [Planococcus halotolerans]QHJ71417.1 hypothetical protein DNR44_012605 [Planococcus halotolerans]